jgi:hypothetical protein
LIGQNEWQNGEADFSHNTQPLLPKELNLDLALLSISCDKAETNVCISMLCSAKYQHRCGVLANIFLTL